MSARPGLLLVAGLSVLGGCGGGGTDVWGVLHGDLTVSGDGAVRGVLVWEFFDSAWERSVSADDHRCARVLTVVGAPVPCDGCAVAVSLQVDELEHDCPGSEGTHPDLRAMDQLQVAPPGKAVAGAWPDDRWAWSLGWSGGGLEAEGVAWDEGFEFGEPPEDPKVLTGRRVRLGAATARRLTPADLEEATASP